MKSKMLKRVQRWQRSRNPSICPKCNKQGAHFVPPSFGGRALGFFFCESNAVPIPDPIPKDTPEAIAARMSDDANLAEEIS